MSGDVFGNGMLLSDHLRLVAAFDHRDVFIDPTPEAASSIVERRLLLHRSQPSWSDHDRRLFDLPRSSWDDYDRSLISADGGVGPRTAKTVPISEQARAAPGIEDATVTALSPAELMRSILKAPVDLLWNGGIGTYVKATE